RPNPDAHRVVGGPAQEALASGGDRPDRADVPGGAHISYGAWAGLFLRTEGVSGCHSNMVAMVSWQVAEFTQAAWNPLATTYHMPGATLFNGSGVRNYVSLSQGLEATRLTIRGGLERFGYGRI